VSGGRRRRLACGIALAAVFVALGLGGQDAARGQGRLADQEGEQRFIEGLRREDPAAADRYVALRDARSQAMADLQRAEAQYQAGGVELRPLLIPRVRDARKTYAETSLALLEFLDARYRRVLAAHDEEARRIKGLLDEHQRMRSELEKLLRSD
jgi:hypothetical protein